MVLMFEQLSEIIFIAVGGGLHQLGLMLVHPAHL